MLPNPEVREVTIQDYLKIIQKRLPLIAALLVIIPLFTLVYVFVTRPVFRATASIAIDKSQVKITKYDDVYKQDQDPNFLQTQYKIINSRTLVEKVFNELRLSNEKDYKSMGDPVGYVMARIKVEPVKNSNMVLINVDDFDPLRAASIANALVNAYIQQDIENRNRKIKEAGGWLESQLEDIKKKVKLAEEALNRYVQENRLSSDAISGQTYQGVLSTLKRRKSNLELTIAENEKRYKSKHPKMIAFQAELDDLNKKIEEETENALNLRKKLVQYNILKKEVDSNQQIYINLLSRSKEADMAGTLSPTNIRLLDSARPPGSPYKPQKVRSLVVAVIFSLLLGFGVSLFMEYLDSTIRTAEDVSMYVNLPFLGFIPTCNEKDFKTESDKYFLCAGDSSPQTSEFFRALRTSLLFSFPEDKKLNTFLVTSSLPAEGKSFVSTNLAWIFSHLNEKVIIVDADMRKPKISKVLNLKQSPGLSSYLIGKASIDQIIMPRIIDKANISVITSGDVVPNPSELLSSNKIGELVVALKERFDRIIFDVPPVLAAPDASLLSKLLDGVIFLIKGADTRLEHILAAKKKLTEAKGKILGAVINNLETAKEDSYYSYYYTADKKV